MIVDVSRGIDLGSERRALPGPAAMTLGVVDAVSFRRNPHDISVGRTHRRPLRNRHRDDVADPDALALRLRECRQGDPDHPTVRRGNEESFGIRQLVDPAPVENLPNHAIGGSRVLVVVRSAPIAIPGTEGVRDLPRQRRRLTPGGEFRLEIRRERPDPGADFARKLPAFEELEPRRFLLPKFLPKHRSNGRIPTHIDEPTRPAGLLDQAPVDVREALFRELARPIRHEFRLGPKPQFLGRDALGALPKSLRDIGPVNHEVRSPRIDTADDDVDVWMVGVVVLDGHPVEARPEVAFDLVHEGLGIAPKREFRSALGRHDQPEVVPVVVRDIDELCDVLVREDPVPAEGLSPSAVLIDAIPLDVLDMARKRSAAILPLVPDHPRLDDDALSARIPGGPGAEDSAAVEAGSCATTTGR